MSQKGYTTNKRYPSVSSFFFFLVWLSHADSLHPAIVHQLTGWTRGGRRGSNLELEVTKLLPGKIIYKLILVGVPAMLSLVHIVSSSENRVCRCSVPRGVYISHFIPPRVSCHRRLDVPKGKKKRKRIQHKGVCLVIVSHIMRITIIIIPQMPLCHVV